MKPLIYTAALAVGYTQRPTSTAYACKQQSAHTATHFACPAFAWARARCIAISAAFPRCKSAWPCLEQFVGLAPKHLFPTRQLTCYVRPYVMFAFCMVCSHILFSQQMSPHRFCVTLHSQPASNSPAKPNGSKP